MTGVQTCALPILIEVEKFPCNDGNEARAREEYWRCHFNSQLNSIRAYRTDEQKKEHTKLYYENNKEKKLEYQKAYYENNKENRIEYQRNYNKKNKTDSSSNSSTECI